MVPELGVMEYETAPGLKTTLSTVIAVETFTVAVLEDPKVATSADPFGTVAGVQLVAVFQSLLVGFKFQVALAPSAAESKKEEVRIKKAVNLTRERQSFISQSQQKFAAISS